MLTIHGTLGAAVPPVDNRAWPAPMQIVVGQDETVRIFVNYSTGVPVLLTGQTLVLTVRDSTAANFTRLSVTGTLKPDVGKNVADFTIADTDTAVIPPGRYVYDVWITAGALAKRPVTPVCAVFFNPAATF